MKRIRVGMYGTRCQSAKGKFVKCRGKGKSTRRKKKSGYSGIKGSKCVRYKRTRAGRRCAKYK